MAKTFVLVLGAVFTLIGILGFVPALTPDDKLLGLFAVDGVHNTIHLLSGLVALFAASRGETYARLYAKVFGVVYAVVTVLGFIVGEGELLGLFSINQADNVLYLVIAAATLYVGFSNPPQRTTAPAA